MVLHFRWSKILIGCLKNIYFHLAARVRLTYEIPMNTIKRVGVMTKTKRSREYFCKVLYVFLKIIIILFFLSSTRLSVNVMRTNYIMHRFSHLSDLCS